MSQRYRRMATRLNLRSTRLHSLRHYSATELLAAGVDLRTVAGRLGHGGGGATTLKVYAAWVDEADRRAAETMAHIMPKLEPTPRPARGPYVTVADSLRADILDGRLKHGDQLPTVVQLASDFTVAAGPPSHGDPRRGGAHLCDAGQAGNRLQAAGLEQLSS